jgi:hypothetical protein
MAVSEDARGMVVFKSKSSCLEKRAFFRSFRVCKNGFHDLLRVKLSSLSVLPGWSSICIASSLIIRFVRPDFIARCQTGCGDPSFCRFRPRLICPDDTAWCVGGVH